MSEHNMTLMTAGTLTMCLKYYNFTVGFKKSSITVPIALYNIADIGNGAKMFSLYSRALVRAWLMVIIH